MWMYHSRPASDGIEESVSDPAVRGAEKFSIIQACFSDIGQWRFGCSLTDRLGCGCPDYARYTRHAQGVSYAADDKVLLPSLFTCRCPLLEENGFLNAAESARSSSRSTLCTYGSLPGRFSKTLLPELPFSWLLGRRADGYSLRDAEL